VAGRARHRPVAHGLIYFGNQPDTIAIGQYKRRRDVAGVQFQVKVLGKLTVVGARGVLSPLRRSAGGPARDGPDAAGERRAEAEHVGQLQFYATFS
jgi:hypothetical protein